MGSVEPATALHRAVVHHPAGGAAQRWRAGGRAVLALLRRGTWRFTDAPRAREAPWQAKIIAGLGLARQARRAFDAEQRAAPRRLAARIVRHLRRRDLTMTHTTTRELVCAWDGGGVDGSLVDVEALRREWSRWPFDSRTAALVQQVWLAGLSTAPGQSDLEAPR
ncbi:hypothetical protein [Micromonospora carbonacea]|uniref:Uncharacterized protein n=1 Tax=Micromonospora carbonacea TaxID=47853 RepID=A0A7H8XDV0_9ACTN|nr:hypothetical protein [Micromonospora carbonacea]MBB5829562.1 hypothetical protein [Micromonospora carbonacea]QLD23035.1 hypothetical protein HXZ27_01225 [Micromonospora carbonacea]